MMHDNSFQKWDALLRSLSDKKHIIRADQMPSINDVQKELSKRYKLPSEQFKPINRFMYEYNFNGQDCILRIIDHRNPAELDAELHWINYLSDHGVGIARALPSPTGQLCDVFDLSGTRYFATTFQKAEGKPPTQKEWCSDLFKKMGRLIGKMHRLTSTYTPVGSRKDWIDEDICDYKKHLPPTHTFIRQKSKETIDAVNVLPKNKDTYGMIHSDIHQTNMHLYNDDITLFDFTDCEQHYFINDLAIVIYWALEVSFNGADIQTYTTTLIKNLFAGYKEENDLDPFWVAQIPKFLKLREVISLIDAHCEWDMESLNENQKIILNHYRKNIEQDRPFSDTNFEHIYKMV